MNKHQKPYLFALFVRYKLEFKLTVRCVDTWDLDVKVGMWQFLPRSFFQWASWFCKPKTKDTQVAKATHTAILWSDLNSKIRAANLKILPYLLPYVLWSTTTFVLLQVTDVISLLKVRNIRESDYGNYTCMAANRYGMDMTVTYIFCKFKMPKFGKVLPWYCTGLTHILVINWCHL